MKPTPHPILLPLLLASLLPACITERITPARGTPVRPATTTASAPRPAPSLPSGPVATPVTPSTTLISHVTAAIKPLGEIHYDGVSLPLTSPDGRFIAVQQGIAPSWDALFAAPDAPPPLASRIGAYAVTDTALEPLTPAADPLSGLLLGRSADNRGFLVESPRPDGSRWIGFVPWSTLDPHWLIQSPDQSSHAILTSAADLLYTRRPAGGGVPTLIWRRPDGVEFAAAFPDASILIPLAGSGAVDTAVLIGSAAGLSLAAVKPAELPSAEGELSLWIGPRRTIGAGVDPALAYQSVASLQIPLPAAENPIAAEGQDPAGVPVFLHARQRMGLFLPQSGSVLPLLTHSVAAVPVAVAPAGVPGGQVGAEGYLLAVPRGLVFLPLTGKGLVDPNATRPDWAATVVTGAFLPRITSQPSCVLLFGQSPNRGRLVYEVSVMMLGVPVDR